jgi:hypothetical protein
MSDCPFCGEALDEPDAPKCPSCGEALLDDMPSGGGGKTVLIVVIVVMAVMACLCVPLIAAIAIPNLIEARKHGNESAAIGALKTISVAQSLFREADKEGDGELDYGSLQELGDTMLIDFVLASGTKQGYIFEASASQSTPEFLHMATARPALPGTTGDRYFAINHEGVIFYSATTPFTLNDACEIPPGVNPVGR